MRVALLADSSPSIGTGHVMRCRALAQALESRGAQTTLDAAPEGGATDWLVVDHYGLDETREREMRSRAKRIFVIDDLADRRHDCDLLLDQNFFPDAAKRYDQLVPRGCRKLLGPRYALLRPEFLKFRKKIKPRTGEVKRILVTFGGLDAGNETARAIALLKGRRIAVDVVVGAANPHAERIARACEQAGFTLHRQASNMAELMAGADLAIGAGGSTTWERCCLGLPTLQVAIAENQEALSQALADAGYVTFVGKRLTEDVVAQALANPRQLVEQSERMLSLVDGKGAGRVAAALFASPDTAISLRNAASADAWLYFEWANDPEVRRQSMQSGPIGWPGHQDWFAKSLAGSVLLVAEDEAGMPLGQVRFEPRSEPKDTWRIGYSVAEEFRGFRLGGRMLAMAIAELQRRKPGASLEAVVKPDNGASRKIFAALGFTQAGADLFKKSA